MKRTFCEIDKKRDCTSSSEGGGSWFHGKTPKTLVFPLSYFRLFNWDNSLQKTSKAWGCGNLLNLKTPKCYMSKKWRSHGKYYILANKLYTLKWYFSSLGLTDETFPLARSIFTFQVEIILLLSKPKASSIIRWLKLENWKSFKPIEMSNQNLQRWNMAF